VVYCLLAAFAALGYYISVELLVQVFTFFKSYRNLYFWSIVVSTVALLIQNTGFILLRLENSWPPLFVFAISKIGWAVNVTAFSLVLWSRLHLVVTCPRLLKGVLVMIIVTAILSLSSSIIFEIGLSHSKYRETFYSSIAIIERIQQVMFTLQEAIIPTLYVYYTARFWRSGYSHHTHRIVSLLACVQVFSVTLDLLLVVTVFMNMLILRCALHAILYAIKLKLEFLVLNQLRSLVHRNEPGHVFFLPNDVESNKGSSDLLEHE
jgi:hypothetical protein